MLITLSNRSHCCKYQILGQKLFQSLEILKPHSGKLYFFLCIKFPSGKKLQLILFNSSNSGNGLYGPFFIGIILIIAWHKIICSMEILKLLEDKTAGGWKLCLGWFRCWGCAVISWQWELTNILHLCSHRNYPVFTPQQKLLPPQLSPAHPCVLSTGNATDADCQLYTGSAALWNPRCCWNGKLFMRKMLHYNWNTVHCCHQ